MKKICLHQFQRGDEDYGLGFKGFISLKKKIVFVDQFCWVSMSIRKIEFCKHFLRVIFSIQAVIFEKIYSLWLFYFFFRKNKNLRSQQPFLLQQNQREFLNCWNNPNHLMMAFFPILVCFLMIFFSVFVRTSNIPGTSNFYMFQAI